MSCPKNIGAELSWAFTRTKHIDQDKMTESKLKRVLNTFDITALGVGATLGAGVYVLTGAVAKETSGPSVVIAFLIAALTSVLSGICYAEFGARVPKAGSGYVYSYVTVGEFCAFVIGWNLILSYVIGAASVARAWTANFDTLVNNTIEKHMMECCSFGGTSGLAPYPDLFSLGIILLLTALIAFGVKEFAIVNKIFTVLNVCVIIFIVVAGMTQADIHNWAWTQEEIYNLTVSMGVPNATMDMYGAGGFMPYGFAGLISGTATCFYAFVGFDCIATTGEEAKNPQTSIPRGIVFSLAICCAAYLLISSTLTLMQPYFLLDKDAPLPYAFAAVGMGWAKYIVTIGAICALSTSLLGAMFPMPRIIYAMAIDGLLFKFLAKVQKKSQTPVIATFISGGLAGIMAVFFDLKALVDLMSIGTLAAYSLVAASVMLLRYQPEKKSQVHRVSSMKPNGFDHDKAMLETAPMTTDVNVTESFSVMMLVSPKQDVPTPLTSSIVNWATGICSLAMVLFSIVMIVAGSNWGAGAITFATIFGIFILVSATIIVLQPQNHEELSFKVPLVPYVPLINMFVNLFLMISLPVNTWIKLIVWMAIGLSIYFFYGMWKSVERTGERAVNELELPPAEKSMNNHAGKSSNNHDDYIVVPTEDKEPLTTQETESEI